MISLFVSNSDQNITSKNGTQITLSLNPPIILDPNKKYYASCLECDIVYFLLIYLQEKMINLNTPK